MKLLGIAISLLFLTQTLLIVDQNNLNLIFGQGDTDNDVNYNNISKNISGITCDKTEHLAFHNHTMLMLKNKDQNVTIPAGIGIIPNDCIFWLHTHDKSGIIHVESPSKTPYSLGQFLQVWNSFDNSSIIKDLMKKDVRNNISILLENGTNIKTTENINNIPLQNNAIISIDLDNQKTK